MKVLVNKRAIAAIILLIAVTGCAKQQIAKDPLLPEARLTEWREVQPGDPEAALLQQALASGALHTIYFGYDKFNLQPESVAKLKTTVAWLLENPAVVIRVEGHCDERGTDAYNLALGQRRATSAMSYLVKGGIAEERISFILSGSHKLAARIRHPQNESLKQRIGFSHQLRGFTLDDALDYVRFHLDRCEAPPELFSENAIKTLFHFAQGLPRVQADANQLQQVLVNLSLNACEAMPDGGTLSISTRGSDEKVLVSIADTGCGIKAEHLEMIFDPFFTTKPVGKGTGLGLSVSYGIIRQHGGIMKVKSQEGRGTTFTFILPAAAPRAKEG